MSKNTHFLYKTHKELLINEEVAGRSLSVLVDEIKNLYLADNRPWIIGFSGGKDSTTILSLIYSALLDLSPKARNKHVFVVSSDTLVETPVVVDMINRVREVINKQGQIDQLPISAHSVYPKIDQTFWVNLLGRGYPAPQQSFRWCTERMKIDPVSSFITDKVAQFGEVIVVLGSRTQESASRAQVIANHAIEGSLLNRHSSLPNAYTYMPIKDWSADEVWLYLMGAPCPWGDDNQGFGDNRELFDLYKGSNQGECPLVIDKSTPSCGNSRFGCWTCTVVTEDRALHGLIESGMKWMKPLLDFRNKIHKSTDPELKGEYRNYKRRTGKVSYMQGDISDDTNKELKHIPGPYWLEVRKKWVKELLLIEKSLKEGGHPFPLIRLEELQAIRQEWLRDPNEPDWADSLPRIYSEVYEDEVEWIENDAGAFTEPDAILLKELGEKHNVPAELIMKLIEVELSVSGLGKRHGIMQKLENVLKRDWESLKDINIRNMSISNGGVWKEKIKQLQHSYDEAPTV
ncbi:MAG: DNA phosphorothioation system sulfurtransferase DndC [Nitrosomonas sp.]|uniref:DNA phosphorothioation system sulfurtransferase DndC n=1 Tax=Nitrosomonas sp. TaxID=42353 RepID=UPI0032ECED6D